MEKLGEHSLFISSYVIGTKRPTNQDVEFVVYLNNWINEKESDWGIKRYRHRDTQYIAYLHIIELPILEEIIKNYAVIYKKSYPCGTKENFLDSIFRFTIHDMKVFIEREYTGYGHCGVDGHQPYDVYYYLNAIENEFIDFIIDGNKNIEYYKQYYRTVLALFNNFDFEKVYRNQRTIGFSLQNSH